MIWAILDRPSLISPAATRRIVPPVPIGHAMCRKLFRSGRDWLEIQECGCFLLIDHPRFLIQLQMRLAAVS